MIETSAAAEHSYGVPDIAEIDKVVNVLTAFFVLSLLIDDGSQTPDSMKPGTDKVILVIRHNNNNNNEYDVDVW